MAVTIADVSNVLTKVIRPFVQDNYDKKTILMDKIKKDSEMQFLNNNFYAPIRSSRHGGITNLADDGNSLITGSSATAQASIGVKLLTGTFDISKLVIDATKTTKGAVVNELTRQAESLANDFAKDVNQQLMGDGIGVIGQVAGSVGAGTLTIINPDSNLDDGRSYDNYGVVNGDIKATKYIRAGQIIGIGTAAADVGTVSTVTTDASGTIGTVVVTGAPAIVANDTIYRLDGDAEGAGTSFVTGVKAALSTATTYANLTRASYDDWTAQRDVTSEALTLSAMEDTYLSATEYSQMGDTYVILVNKTLFKKYGDILTAMRRTVDSTELISGWTGLEFAAGNGRVGVFLDYDVPDGAVFILNLDTWVMAETSPMDWLDDPQGGALIRRRDKITYQATMAWFMNLLCVAPAANGVLYRKTD